MQTKNKFYQCKKITGRPANINKTVSNNSIILLKTKAHAALPVFPSPNQYASRHALP